VKLADESRETGARAAGATAATAAMAGARTRPEHPDCNVGSRIAVYWSDDDEYYSGQIKFVQKKKQRVFVEYDDGDSEWVDLKKSKVKPDVSASGRNVDAILKAVVQGSRVSVWWPAEKKYFPAEVRKIVASKPKHHFLVYDDGDEEWTNLAFRKFHFIDKP